MDVVPFAPEHLDAVADLLRTNVSPELERDPKRFRRYIDCHYLSGPNRDAELPSLVAVDDIGRVTGFCGVTASRLKGPGRSIRVVASGPLVADPSSRAGAPGLFLTRALLSGAQDLSLTDGANDSAVALWTRMGAEVVARPSYRWLRPLRPSGLALSLAAHRLPVARHLIGRTSLLDRQVMRRFADDAPATSDRPLEPDRLPGLVDRVASAFTLVPDYAAGPTEWQFDELAKVTAKGSLVARLVEDGGGRTVGWFVYYLIPNGLCRVMQIGCRPRDAEAVFAHLCHHADRNGGGALFGRFEAHYDHAVRQQPILIAPRSPRFLIHAVDPEIRLSVHSGRALITRLEGEAWNGVHHQPIPADQIS